MAFDGMPIPQLFMSQSNPMNLDNGIWELHQLRRAQV